MFSLINHYTGVAVLFSHLPIEQYRSIAWFNVALGLVAVSLFIVLFRGESSWKKISGTMYSVSQEVQILKLFRPLQVFISFIISINEQSIIISSNPIRNYSTFNKNPSTCIDLYNVDSVRPEKKAALIIKCIRQVHTHNVAILYRDKAKCLESEYTEALLNFQGVQLN